MKARYVTHRFGLPTACLSVALALAGCGGGGGGGSSNTTDDAVYAVPTCVGRGPGVAMLSWTPPTVNNDGSPTIIKEYRIYCEGSRGGPLQAFTVQPPATTFLVTGLPVGTHHFALTAVSITGGESDFSNVETKIVSP
jgi:hypothetical protein